VDETMDAELGIYKRQGLLIRLHSIRKRIYLGVADLDTYICTAKEPIPFDQRRTYQSRKITNTAIGHSHLDLAWLWPIRETKRKAVRTFTNALNNIEKYPTKKIDFIENILWLQYPQFTLDTSVMSIQTLRLGLQSGISRFI
jgi:hypothetical protein